MSLGVVTSPQRSRGRTGTEQSDSSPLTLLARRHSLSRADRDTWRLSSSPNARRNVWDTLASGLPTSHTGRTSPLLSRPSATQAQAQAPASRAEESSMLENYLPLPPAKSSPSRPAHVSTQPPAPSSPILSLHSATNPPAVSSPSRSLHSTTSLKQRSDSRSVRKIGSLSSPSVSRHPTPPQVHGFSRLHSDRGNEGSSTIGVSAREWVASVREVPIIETSAREGASIIGASGREESFVGASAHSNPSAREHGAHADWLEDFTIESPATLHTSVGGKICDELRWLRKSSALVSKYDAVLHAKVERLENLQESRQARRAGETKKQIMARFTDAKSWFVEKLCARISQLLLAAIIAGWMEIALRPHAIEEVLASACLRAFKLYCFFFWRRSAGCQHAETVITKLRDEMRRYQETEQIKLKEVQYLREKIKKHSFRYILEALGRSLGTHLDVFRPKVFQAWREIVTSRLPVQQQPAAKASIRLGGTSTLCTSIILMAHFCTERAILRSWHLAVRSMKKALRLEAMMTKTLLVMKGATERDIMRFAFDSWYWSRMQHKRKNSFNPVISPDSLVMKLAAVKAHSKAIRVKHAEQSMKVFAELTDAGIKAKAFKSWRSKTEETLAEQRLAMLKQQLQEAETDKHCRAISLWEAVLRDVELLEISSLSLLFATWLRNTLQGEQAKLNAALQTHERLNDDLQDTQHQVRDHMAFGAAVVIASHLHNWIRKVQHCTLVQLSLGAKRVVTGRLLRDAVDQRQSASIEERQTLSAMRVQARQRHIAAAHFGTNFVFNWYVNLRRIFLGLWAAAAADSAISRRWEQRMKCVEAQRAQFQAASRANRKSRKGIAETLLSDVGYIVECRKVWNAWTQSLFAKQAVDELEEQQRRIKEEEESLCAEIMRKKSEVQLPMLEWVAQILGTRDGDLLRKLPIIFKEWHQGAKLLKIERKQQLIRAFSQDFAFFLVCDSDRVIERTLLGRVVLVWHIDASLSHHDKDRVKSVNLRKSWDLISSRLRYSIQAITRLLEKRDGADLVSLVFIEWRRLVCVSSVERTGKEVRLALDDRIMAGKRALQSEQILLEKALAVTHWETIGSIFIAEIAARLVFPAWRLYAADEHRRRATLMDENERFQQIEVMQQRSLLYCVQWSYWVARGCFSILGHSCVESVYRAWRLLACAQTMGRRRHSRAMKFNAAVAKVLEMGHKLRVRVFAGWQRVLQWDAKLSLEARLRDLEDQFIRRRGEGDRGAAIRELAEIQDESSSDESSDSSNSGTFAQSSPGSRASRASRKSGIRGSDMNIDVIPNAPAGNIATSTLVTAAASGSPIPSLPLEGPLGGQMKIDHLTHALAGNFARSTLVTSAASGSPVPSLPLEGPLGGEMNIDHPIHALAGNFTRSPLVNAAASSSPVPSLPLAGPRRNSAQTLASTVTSASLPKEEIFERRMSVATMASTVSSASLPQEVFFHSSPPTSLSPPRLVSASPNQNAPTSLISLNGEAQVKSTTVFQSTSQSPFPYPWTQLPAPTRAGPGRRASSPVQYPPTGQVSLAGASAASSSPTMSAGVLASGSMVQAPPQILVKGSAPFPTSQEQLQGVTVGLARRGTL